MKIGRSRGHTVPGTYDLRELRSANTKSRIIRVPGTREKSDLVRWHISRSKLSPRIIPRGAFRSRTCVFVDKLSEYRKVKVRH